MAEKTKTSFIQYEYCNLCRLSHRKRKKHVYSKHHQVVLQNILSKYENKIATAKESLFTPHVEDADFENGAKFWCYFCGQEFEKHKQIDDCSLIGGGLLAHIVTDVHMNNMSQFFWDNFVDKKLKSKYAISEQDYEIFMKSARLAVLKKQKAKLVERKQIAVGITVKESQRQEMYGWTHGDKSVTSLQGTTPVQEGNQSTRSYPARRTVSAYAPGLTCILKKDTTVAVIDGNVHTGATPPWLRPDTPSNQIQEIGPSIKDLQKHLDFEKKAKLPKNRVGANFDRSGSASEEWLPSFGRVWTKGRRLQSKHHFEKEQKLSGKPQSHYSATKDRFLPYIARHGAAIATITSEQTDQGIDSTDTGSFNHQTQQHSQLMGDSVADYMDKNNDIYSCNSNSITDSHKSQTNSNSITDSHKSQTMLSSEFQSQDSFTGTTASSSHSSHSNSVETFRPYRRARAALGTSAPYQRSSSNQSQAKQSRDLSGLSYLSLLQTPVLSLQD